MTERKTKPAGKPAAKSVDKPAAKPAGKSVDEPADKPIDKPADKPAGKPVAKPVDKPAAKPAGKSESPAAHHPSSAVAEFSKTDTEDLRKAADGGDAKAMRALGARYKTGRGVEHDYTQMERWWERSAEAGDATAMWDLGYYHLIGKYLEKDTAKAIGWFDRAIDAGNAQAALELGLDFERGQFVDKDPEAAQRYLKRAADMGDGKAAEELEAIERRKVAAEKREAKREEPPHGARGRDIELIGVSERFGKKVVLDDISLKIKGGELIAIVGGSGGGKSTLVNIMRGALKPTEGTVRFEGDFGFVPQQNLVHESLTVREQLAFYAASVKKLPRAEQGARIEKVMQELDLEHAAGNIIHKCSGGEIRRVSVACELLSQPDSLLLNEPTSGLDPGDSGDLIDVLHDLVHSNSMTTIVINHDYENIKLFDKVLFLAKGKICFYGTPKRLFEYFDTTSSRLIYDRIRDNPDPFIRRFEEWRLDNPDVVGGIR